MAFACSHADPAKDGCGGCSLQPLSLLASGAQKEAGLRRALEQAGIVAEEWHPYWQAAPQSRRRASMALLKKGKLALVGFNRARSHQIIALRDCAVVMPALLHAAQALQQQIAPLPGNIMADIHLTQADNGLDAVMYSSKPPDHIWRGALLQWGEALNLARISWAAKTAHEPEPIAEWRQPIIRHGEFAVKLPAGGFLQAVPQAEQQMVAVAKEFLAAAPLIDFYCGSGAFSLGLYAGQKIWALDMAPAALSALEAVKNQQQLHALSITRRNLAKEPPPAKLWGDFKAAIIDPPRSGAPLLCQEIAASKLARLVMVSCNPTSLISDLAQLVKAGFKLRAIQAIDQFIWSSHLEVLACLER